MTAHLLFNTVRRDRRDRTYTMADASYSILMSVVGPVLEAAAASLPSLQCVKSVRACSPTTRRPGAGGVNSGKNRL